MKTKSTERTIETLKADRENIIVLIKTYFEYNPNTYITMNEAMTEFMKWYLKGKIAPIQWVDKLMKKNTKKTSTSLFMSEGAKKQLPSSMR